MSEEPIPTNLNAEHFPNKWFSQQFPAVFKKHGPALEIVPNRQGYSVCNLNDDFFADVLGNLGSSKTPTIYVTGEQRFYQYDNELGIFVYKSEEQIVTEVSGLLHRCADDCQKYIAYDTTALRFRLSKAGALNGVIKKARGFLHVENDFFLTTTEEFIACKNGMLRLADNVLMPFSPEYRRRSKLEVSYDPNAKCPLFLDTLMAQSLEPEDTSFLQKWFGQALLGDNKTARIVILTGTAEGGKSTFVKVVVGVIGKQNVVSLRTEMLHTKFEQGFYIGKSLLYGADVPPDFLNHKSAVALKALTGGDPMTVELKNVRQQIEIIGNYNIIVTSNARLLPRVEGDEDALRRRFVIIEYRKPKPKLLINAFSDLILNEEGPGVLNWALGGLKQLRDANWKLTLSAKHAAIVDRTLLEAQSVKVFAKECLIESEGNQITLDELYKCYLIFCKQRSWTPLIRTKAGKLIEKEIVCMFGIGESHNIVGATSTEQRGYNGVTVKNRDGTSPTPSVPSDPVPDPGQPGQESPIPTITENLSAKK